MSKAYDIVNWNFLLTVLQKKGFPHRFLTLIKHAIQNCWFTVLVNGETTGFFKSSQGLRQGDPLSPALFILAAEALSRGLDLLFNENPGMFYHTNCEVKISHLSYADDVILFTNCEEESLTKLMQFLHNFEESSGQKINHAKSAFIPGKNANLMAHRIKHITGFSRKALPITYLGAPLYKGNKKKILYENLIDKVRNKIAGWEHCHLSYGGRLQLIKTVLSSMPIYLLQVLNPLVGTIQKLEQLFAKYFWGSISEQRKIHWTKWQNICYPIEEGGLGIRNLREMTTTFSYKLWWRLRLNNSLWSKFSISKYCGGYFPTLSKIFMTDSSTWKRLGKIRREVQTNIFWSPGAGTISFWRDWWLPEGTIANILGTHCNLHVPVNWFWNNSVWDANKHQQVVPQHIIDLIMNVPITDSQTDCLHWKLSKNGTFTTKSAWNEIRSHQSPQLFYRTLWSKLIIPNISVFIWRLIHNWVPVDERLKQKGITMASKCYCCEAEETIPHLFLHNNKSLEAWGYFAAKFQINIPQTNDITILIQS
ncbi:UNVERIFIED_CONTAM: hypothetical protein Sindi_1291000 [Sesamum indicum]